MQATDLHRGRQGGCPLGLVGGGIVKTKGEGRAVERDKTKDFSCVSFSLNFSGDGASVNVALSAIMCHFLSAQTKNYRDVSWTRLSKIGDGSPSLFWGEDRSASRKPASWLSF